MADDSASANCWACLLDIAVVADGSSVMEGT